MAICRLRDFCVFFSDPQNVVFFCIQRRSPILFKLFYVFTARLCKITGSSQLRRPLLLWQIVLDDFKFFHYISRSPSAIMLQNILSIDPALQSSRCVAASSDRLGTGPRSEPDTAFPGTGQFCYDKSIKRGSQQPQHFGAKPHGGEAIFDVFKMV